ncbi:hypothetical protein [Helicobacter bizzozeronii]|uniref:hypothetical protein n=1 Tax=Helicobacter bizzozeronii TaxID=56877 RepID=UPI000CF0EB7D|nr:hypothetical protein [Helicobacter bizzozeronii]
MGKLDFSRNTWKCFGCGKYGDSINLQKALDCPEIYHEHSLYPAHDDPMILYSAKQLCGLER